MHREATQFYIPILLAIMLAAALTYYWLEINRPRPVPEPATAPALVEPLVDEPVDAGTGGQRSQQQFVGVRAGIRTTCIDRFIRCPFMPAI